MYRLGRRAPGLPATSASARRGIRSPSFINRAAYGHERVLVSRRGRPIAAIVPIQDIEFIERIEDELDRHAALEALADPENADPIPWEQVKANLGV